METLFNWVKTCATAFGFIYIFIIVALGLWSVGAKISRWFKQKNHNDSKVQEDVHDQYANGAIRSNEFSSQRV